MIILHNVCLLQKSSFNVRVVLADVDTYCKSVRAQLQYKINIAVIAKQLFGLRSLDQQYLNICLLSAWLTDDNPSVSNEPTVVGSVCQGEVQQPREPCLLGFSSDILVSVLGVPFPLASVVFSQ